MSQYHYVDPYSDEPEDGEDKKEELQSKPVAQYEEEIEPQKPSKFKGFGPLVAFVILILGVGGFLYYQQNSDKALLDQTLSSSSNAPTDKEFKKSLLANSKKDETNFRLQFVFDGEHPIEGINKIMKQGVKVNAQGSIRKNDSSVDTEIKLPEGVNIKMYLVQKDDRLQIKFKDKWYQGEDYSQKPNTTLPEVKTSDVGEKDWEKFINRLDGEVREGKLNGEKTWVLVSTLEKYLKSNSSVADDQSLSLLYDTNVQVSISQKDNKLMGIRLIKTFKEETPKSPSGEDTNNNPFLQAQTISTQIKGNLRLDIAIDDKYHKQSEAYHGNLNSVQDLGTALGLEMEKLGKKLRNSLQ